MSNDLEYAFHRLKRAAAGLPDVEEATSYGTPSLKVRGKGFCRVKDADTVVVMVSHEEKELLLEAAPDIYFETDHYKGWPAMLVRIRVITDEELAHRLKQAWLLKAPKTVARKLAGGPAPPTRQRGKPGTAREPRMRAATPADLRPGRPSLPTPVHDHYGPAGSCGHSA